MYTYVYMPCSSELQLCSMGQIYPRFAIELEYCVTDAEDHERVKKFSPYIPIDLSCLRDQMDEFEKSRQKEIACNCFTKKFLNYAMKSPIQIKYSCMSGLTHLSAQYVINWDSAECFLGYAFRRYEISCEEVLDVLSIAIEKALKLWNSTWLLSINVKWNGTILFLYIWKELLSFMLLQAWNGNAGRCNCTHRLLAVLIGLILVNQDFCLKQLCYDSCMPICSDEKVPTATMTSDESRVS